LKDPKLSPVYGQFTGFPPTFLVSGTRDSYLSNTVRVHCQLLRAGVPTQLLIEEGQSHGWLLVSSSVNAPENREVYAYIGRFFDTHLGH
jgi:epsilon-lactone hydrolase